MYNIYKIVNIDNGRSYIGMTSGIVKDRYKKHVRHLRNGTHCNTNLQGDWDRGHRFIVAKITYRKHKEVAKALETKLMNEIEGTYNIAKGNPGDLAGRLMWKFREGNRAHIYAEINAMKGEPQRLIMKRFNISQPMVSMILSGFRTAPQPNTSFANVFCCDLTAAHVLNPANSEFFAMYAEAA